MLNEEVELVSSLTATIASFKEDPSLSGAKQRGAGSRSDDSHDPDVWGPPPPQPEPTWVV